MEQDAREFLKRVGKTMTIVFLWMVINAFAAIKNDNGFIVGSIRIANILFYVWFVISIVLLVYILKKMWNKPLPNEE